MFLFTLSSLFILLLSSAAAFPSSAYGQSSSVIASRFHSLVSSKSLVDPLPEPLTCDACVFIVGIAQEIAENKTTFAEVTAIVEQGCTVIDDPAFKAVCDGLLSGLLALLPFLDQQLRTLAWDIPLGFCATFFPVCTIPCCETDTVPEQLHLSFTGNDFSEMGISWTTLNATATSIVQWQVGDETSQPPFSNTASGYTWTYTFGGWLGVLHMSVMTGLVPSTRYAYRVGDPNGGWSQVYSFKTLDPQAGTTVPLKIAQIGDAAYDSNSDVTYQSLTQLALQGQIDFVMHIGDISYADGFEAHWDMFFRKIQNISARIPYMTCKGNHEIWNGFIAYESRWKMPNATVYGAFGGPNNSSWYSLDFGSTHVVFFNTETADDTGDVDGPVVSWLKADLTTAKTNNHSIVIAGAHRPLYCTNGGYKSNNKDCTFFGPIMRDQVESVFASVESRADLVLGAHMHGYERTEAVLNSNVVTAAVNNTYTHPGAPVYIVNGAAGNREGNDNPQGDAPWSAPGAHYGTIGYALMQVSTNLLHYQFYAANQTVLDSFTITKV